MFRKILPAIAVAILMIGPAGAQTPQQLRDFGCTLRGERLERYWDCPMPASQVDDTVTGTIPAVASEGTRRAHDMVRRPLDTKTVENSRRR